MARLWGWAAENGVDSCGRRRGQVWRQGDLCGSQGRLVGRPPDGPYRAAFSLEHSQNRVGRMVGSLHSFFPSHSYWHRRNNKGPSVGSGGGSPGNQPRTRYRPVRNG